MRRLKSFMHESRLFLGVMSAALALVTSLFLLCPFPSAADGEDVSRDLAILSPDSGVS